MAVVAGRASATAVGTGGSRTFTATVSGSTTQLENLTPGQQLSVTVTQTASGVTPPGTPNTFTLDWLVDNSTTVIRSYGLITGSDSQTITFYMTSNGLVNGTPQAGTMRLRLRATRTDLPTYSVDSDDTTVSSSDRGYLRANTTLTDSISDVALAGAAPTSALGYGNTLFHQVRLEHGLFASAGATLSVEPYTPVTVYKNYTLADGLIPADWTTTPVGTITTDHPTTGNSYKFPTITHAETATVTFTFTSTEVTDLTYVYKVSSEAGYDFLRVDVAGVQKNYSGETGWVTDSITGIAAGTHTVRLRYTKDSSASVGQDTAWVTNIKVATQPVTTVLFNTSTTAQQTFNMSHKVEKRFTKALASYTVDYLVNLSSLTNIRIAGITRRDEKKVFDADPRLRFVPLHQKNDSAYAATNPISKHKGSQRLTSDLSFLSTRVINARNIGQDGLVFTSKLWDGRELISSEASPVAQLANATTTTRGGETGWSPSFTVWDEALPGGTWNFKHNFTQSGSDYFGLERDALHVYTLVAADPNLRLIAGAGPTDDRRHFVPGAPFITLVGVLNISTGKRLAVDSGTAQIALVRVLLNRSILQYLSLAGVWTDVTNEATVEYHTLDPLAGDPHTYFKTFTATTDWGASDIVVVGRAEIGGVPVSGSDKEITVQTVNNHDQFQFDGAGFVGFPTR